MVIKKKGVICFLIGISIILFSINVSAFTIDLKEEYKSGETIIVEVNANFIEVPTKENFRFWYWDEDVMVHDFPSDKEIGKMDTNTYYLYTILPQIERNYTLIVEDLHYFKAREEVKEDFEVNFSIKEETAPFTIKPGFISTEKDFSLELINNIGQKIEVESEFLDKEKTIEIPPFGEKEIEFSIDHLNKSKITKIHLSSEGQDYEIPTKIFIEKEKNDIVLRPGLEFEKSKYEFTTKEDEIGDTHLTIKNTGEKNITNIVIEYSNLEETIEINPKNISYLEPNQSTILEVTILPKEEGIVEGVVYLDSDQIKTQTFLEITTKKEEDIDEDDEIVEKGRTCEDVGGYLCEENEECPKGLERDTIDEEVCCIIKCVGEENNGFDSGRIIALIIIFIILGIIGFFVYKRMKEDKKTMKDKLQETSKRYEQKFKQPEQKKDKKRGFKKFRKPKDK